jgi:teichuronic acid biosynthesis glycosyltransferase TuaC
MKILFLFRSTDSEKVPAAHIAAQAESLQAHAIDVSYYSITGNSFLNYLFSCVHLRKFIKKNNFDIIHAHYSLCGLTAILAFAGKPIILSLMGSDVFGEYIAKSRISFRSKIVLMITKMVQYFVAGIIVKSPSMFERVIKKNNATIIPNGVNLDKFFPIDKVIAKRYLGLKCDRKYVLYLSNPENVWKNFSLAKEAVNMLDRSDTILISPYPVEHSKIVLYLNAADVFITTSFMEGSSNVLKEAMACNCPIVSSDVGDARFVIGDTIGCRVSPFEPHLFCSMLKDILSFAQDRDRTNGRDRILKLHLDSDSTALKLITFYNRALTKKV